MRGSSGGWPDGHRHRGDAEPARVVTGRVWPLNAYPAPPPDADYGGGAPDFAGRTVEQAQVIDHVDTADDRRYDPYTPPSEHQPRRRRRLLRVVFSLVVALFLIPSGTYVWAATKLNQDVDFGKLPKRPPPGKGTNYLIVGSDSREGLTTEAKKELHTGTADGRRTDSMILLHTGANGTTMMSLPRDSWVTLPSFIRPDTGVNYDKKKVKLNAAFSLGGPELLVRTIERNTGLHIDHYAEIGFAGFVGIVDAVGGVEMCLDHTVKDEKSGADLKKGCQTLDGTEALAFVRQRHQEAEGDLGRTKNQQRFLSALARKAASPGVALDPAKLFSTVGASLDTLIVDKSTNLQDLAALFQTMRSVTAGNGKRINVPVSDIGYQTRQGSAVLWDKKRARQLFSELRNDEPVTIEEKTGRQR